MKKVKFENNNKIFFIDDNEETRNSRIDFFYLDKLHFERRIKQAESQLRTILEEKYQIFLHLQKLYVERIQRGVVGEKD